MSTTSIDRNAVLLSEAEAEEASRWIRRQENEARMQELRAKLNNELERQRRFDADVKFVCEEAVFAHKTVLVALADGLDQLSVAFRNDLLPKKKSNSVLATADAPVQTVEGIIRTFDKMFNFIAGSIKRANRVFKDGTGSFDWGDVDNFKSLIAEIEEEITANKLEDLFGASCIRSYVNFAAATESIQRWWYHDHTSPHFSLSLGIGSLLSAQHDADTLLSLTRQSRKTRSVPQFAIKYDKKSVFRIQTNNTLKAQRRSRIYGKKSTQEGFWPTNIKTCADWDYFRSILSIFDDYMNDSWVGFNCLEIAGRKLILGRVNFSNVINAAITFCSDVVVALNRLAGISVSSISGDSARMRSRLSAAATRENSTERAYATNFQKHQISTNGGFWYGMKRMEEAFASMAGVPVDNWKRSNKEQNLYNMGLKLYRSLNAIMSSFDKIIEYYDVVNGTSGDKTLTYSANRMISEGVKYKAEIDSARATIDGMLRSYTNLNTYLSINSFNSLLECTCDGHPMPTGRFTNVQRALIAKYHVCGPR
jgi:hypothetical protein